MKKSNRTLVIVCSILAVCLFSAGAFHAFSSYKAKQTALLNEQLPTMTLEEMIEYTSRGEKDARITVGILKDGKSSYTVYGENGEVLPLQSPTYEIGSITKTFTAALLFKAIGEGRISLDDRIDKYLELPERAYYPTVRRLVTHTAGYKAQYITPALIAKFLTGQNPLYGYSQEQLIKQIGDIELEDKDYPFEYSNLGISVIGVVLSRIYSQSYATLMEEFIKNDLGLDNTRVLGEPKDFRKYWAWKEDDGYLSCGAIKSSITDMLEYASILMDAPPDYLAAPQEKLTETKQGGNELQNLHMEGIGATWFLDEVNNITYHGGGTDHFNSYLGFNKEKQTAVVVLANFKMQHRISASTMGIKCLVQELNKN